MKTSPSHFPNNGICSKITKIPPAVMILSNQNANAIYGVLRAHPKGLTRGQICAETHLPWTTAYDTLARLLLGALVGKGEKMLTGKRGRPKVFWCAIAGKIPASISPPTPVRSTGKSITGSS